jgi:hypothetical protein
LNFELLNLEQPEGRAALQRVLEMSECRHHALGEQSHIVERHFLRHAAEVKGA